MRLPMFGMMDAAASLLDQRRDFYQACSFELQELIGQALSGDSLLSMSVRVKKAKSLREKILRKRLYTEYDNQYDLLNNLSDLIGLRAECRFLREEAYLFQRLCDQCSLRHEDDTFSIPSHPNIRFSLDVPQPQTQVNGLQIYRIDGKYYKNGVCAPFELQIKALVHVFWAEVEHQLIYKNNTYMLMNGFLKKLLYSNYDSLQQLDQHLQLIYDQMQANPVNPEEAHYSNIRPLVAKTLSDTFMAQMKDHFGFSTRLDKTCDVLTQYLLMRCNQSGNPFSMLFENIRNASSKPIQFDETLELDGAFQSDDIFSSTLACHFTQQLNMDYDWNLLFRLLFTLEDGSNLDIFASFIEIYRGHFCNDALYAHLPEERRDEVRDEVLCQLACVLTQYGDISIFYEDTLQRLDNAIERICKRQLYDPSSIREVLLLALPDQHL